MKKRFKKKINWKQVICIVLCVALVAAIGVTVTSAFAKDADDDGYLKVTPKFSIGGLTDEGLYEETDASLYTKDAIEASDVKVVLDFDSTVQYQLFFYDEVDEFVSASVILQKGSETNVPEGATAFRIMLTPVWDDDVDKDDRKITIFNKYSFTKQITVKIIEIDDSEPDEDPDAAA